MFSIGALCHYICSMAVPCETVYDDAGMFFSMHRDDERTYLEAGAQNIRYIHVPDSIQYSFDSVRNNHGSDETNGRNHEGNEVTGPLAARDLSAGIGHPNTFLIRQLQLDSLGQLDSVSEDTMGSGCTGSQSSPRRRRARRRALGDGDDDHFPDSLDPARILSRVEQYPEITGWEILRI